MARGDPPFPLEHLVPYFRGGRFAMVAVRGRRYASPRSTGRSSGTSPWRTATWRRRSRPTDCAGSESRRRLPLPGPHLRAPADDAGRQDHSFGSSWSISDLVTGPYRMSWTLPVRSTKMDAGRPWVTP